MGERTLFDEDDGVGPASCCPELLPKKEVGGSKRPRGWFTFDLIFEKIRNAKRTALEQYGGMEVIDRETGMIFNVTTIHRHTHTTRRVPQFSLSETSTADRELNNPSPLPCCTCAQHSVSSWWSTARIPWRASSQFVEPMALRFDFQNYTHRYNWLTTPDFTQTPLFARKCQKRPKLSSECRSVNHARYALETVL